MHLHQQVRLRARARQTSAMVLTIEAAQAMSALQRLPYEVQSRGEQRSTLATRTPAV